MNQPNKPQTEGSPLRPDNFLEAFAEAVARRLEHMQSQRRRLMNVESAAAYLDMTEDAVYHLVSKGKLKPVRVDSRNRFDVRDLDRFIEGGKRED